MLQLALGPELTGAYLHGSGVLGGFDAERSDLDVLAVSRQPLSDDALHAVAEALGAGSYPANGLEFTLLTVNEAGQPQMPAPRFQLHRTTDGWDRRAKVVDGRTREETPISSFIFSSLAITVARSSARPPATCSARCPARRSSSR